MKKKIRIFFADFWKNFDLNNNFITNCLRNRYEIIIDNQNPEYLFYSSQGESHFKYDNCIKIYFTGENDIPDFNICDYGIGFSALSFNDRYFRLPLYKLYEGYDNLFSPKSFIPEKVINRKFCNFVYTNSKIANPIRIRFFHLLSQYKPIDSGGRYLNNIGNPVNDKIDFIKDYKFTIAFENSSVSGYTTEKLTDPMKVNSIPIYWGNPDVDLDFNPKSFIKVSDFTSLEKAMEQIIYLDNHDDEYLKMLSQPWILNEENQYWKEDLTAFLENILDKPLSKAKKVSSYGFSCLYLKKQKRASLIHRFTSLFIK